MTKDECVAVIGLGYVGLPLAAAFGRSMRTIGFDVSESRVAELRKGHDRNGDLTPEELASPQLTLSSDPSVLAEADAFVVAVPTPVDASKRPDLSALRSASRTIGAALALRAKRRPPTPALVVFESTVYPGCTEEDCVPVIAQASGLRVGIDFSVGYSPERINPGDREHRLDTIVKIVAGQDAETLERVATLYLQVAKAGVYRAPDIKTAEAAKVIENTQRDLNIALMNELAILFHRMGIDTQEVLKAAGTKWNFLPFKPGLVGGHCIPEDPYYLTHKAESVGYHAQVILAGRKINDHMGEYVAHETVKTLAKAGQPVHGARVLVLGASFKEDVPDTRNSRVVDIARELADYGVEVHVHDPIVGSDGVRRMGLQAVTDPFVANDRYAAVIVAVAHAPFKARGYGGIVALTGEQGVVVDVKGILLRSDIERTGRAYWRL